MHVQQFAEIIMASLDPAESPAGFIANATDLETVEACLQLNLSLAAREMFVVPAEGSGDLLIIHEPSIKADPQLRNTLVSITVKDGFKLVNKEHLL
jgi:hypothetical protein